MGADPLAGDGAGILLQVPDPFLRDEMGWGKIELPPAGEYGVGMLFLPRDAEARAACEKIVAERIAAEGQLLLGWRDVPVDSRGLGESVKKVEPVVRQVFIGRGKNCRSGCVRAQAVRDPQDRGTRGKRLAKSQGKGFYMPLAVFAHHRLQGHAAGQSGRQILPRSAGQQRGQRAGAGAPALLHQHLPDLGSRPSVPHDRAQRRDQHRARQRELDGRAPWRRCRRSCWAKTWKSCGR